MYAALADATATVRVLERAYDLHDMAVLFMNAPTFDAVRHDASFRRLQRRVNYPALAVRAGSTTRD